MARTRIVSKHKAIDYLQRAQELGNAMRSSNVAGDSNAAIINAIHCAISACDAVCVHAMGVRHAGDSHSDAAALLASLPGQDIQNASRQLSRLLGIKTDAEYGERLFTEKEANEAVRDAERVLAFAKSKLKA